MAFIFKLELSEICVQAGAVKKNNPKQNKLFFFVKHIFKINQKPFLYERIYLRLRIIYQQILIPN